MEYNLNWKEKILSDESIEKIDYREYNPHQGVNLNTVGDIRISIHNQDQFILPSRSYLYIEGLLTPEEDGTYDKNESGIALVNNALMYLFDRVGYQIDNKTIESFSNPGIATTMKSLVTYPLKYTEGMKFFWYPDNNVVIDNNNGFKARCNFTFDGENAGNFSAVIPLSHIFGFCENYDKVMYGMKHEINLHRSLDNDAIYKSSEQENGVDKVSDGKIELSKVSWRMPYLKVSDEYKIELYKDIQNKVELGVNFLNRQFESIDVPHGITEFDWRLSLAVGAEKPRYILLALQTNRTNDQTKNNSNFDHCNIKNAFVELNSERYPETDLNLSFDKGLYATAYNMLTDYFNEVIGKVSCPVKFYQFKTMYPILVFDVSRQSERLKNSVTDIKIRMNFSKAIPVATKAYGLILSDRHLKLEADGLKMNIVY